MTNPDDINSEETTKAGNYFVSNYPPYSFWRPDYVKAAYETLESPPEKGTPLGIYIHIPFCRKRCHFCYFRVYTDKNAKQIENYLEAAVKELTLFSKMPFIGNRKLNFIYFGGGTPSYISVKQLAWLTDQMKNLLPWDQAEEITFECEPGTLTEAKLKEIKNIGVTRLSLGVENFSDRVLELNGRAHLSAEINRSYEFAQTVGFPQINIDLIAGLRHTKRHAN